MVGESMQGVQYMKDDSFHSLVDYYLCGYVALCAFTFTFISIPFLLQLSARYRNTRRALV